MDFFTQICETPAGRIFLSGAAVNFYLILLGGILGVLLKKGIPERFQENIMKGMALCVIYIGVSGVFEDGARIIVIILSLGLGAVIGELLDLDKQVNRLAVKIENTISKKGGPSQIAEGFVAATLLFCVGAMAVVGSINSGLSGDNAMLYSKSLIDAISAAVLAASLGAGVIFSAVSVLIFEGCITLLAFAVAPLLNDAVVTQMSVIGSLFIIALALNMLKITKIKVMNLLPAVFLPLLFCLFI